MPRSIEDQVRKTYFSLRLSAAVIAFAFPILLVAGGWWHSGLHLRDSLSAYYHATPHSLKASSDPCPVTIKAGECPYPEAGVMRNWFVGILFAIGAILHANKGHTEKENVFLSLAGLFAVGIAVFPMPWACKPSGHFTPHGTFAIAFFVCIAFVSVVCSEDTVTMLRKERQTRYRTLYRIWGFLMISAPLAAYIFNRWGIRGDDQIFWAEVAGIYAFGLYWVTKTFEIKEIQREQESKLPAAVFSKVTIA